MQKLITSVIVAFFLFPLQLFATQYYIKVATVGKNYASKEIQKIKNAGYSVALQPYKNYIRIYIGGFHSKQQAQQILPQVQKKFAKDAFITKLTLSKKQKVAPKKKLQNTAYFIKVTTIANQLVPKTVESLQIAGFSPYLQPYNKKFTRIYVGSYPTYQKAQKNLSYIRKHFARDAFITKLKIKQSQPKKSKKTAPPVVKKTQPHQQVQQLKQPKPKQNQPKQHISTTRIPTHQEKSPEVSIQQSTLKQQTTHPYFLLLELGSGSVSTTVKGEIPLDITLSENSFNALFALGYNFSSHFYTTLNYQYATQEDYDLHNFYLTLGYKLPLTSSFTTYIAVAGGMSLLDWKNYPLESIESIDLSTSYLAGGEAGIEYSFSSEFSLLVSYKYWLLDYTTILNSVTDSTTITFDGEQSLNFGMKYSF